MPVLKPGTIIPSDEEDAAITAAAMSDPDARPLTDEEWETVKPRLHRGGRPVAESSDTNGGVNDAGAGRPLAASRR